VKTPNRFRSLYIVKVSRKSTLTFAVFISLVLLLSFDFSDQKAADAFDKYYGSQLQTTKEKLTYLKEAIEKKAAIPDLRKLFIDARFAYKKLSVLSEYFKPFESFSLNSPAIPRVEDDVPNVIIPPQGFQAVEELIYKDWSDDHYEKLNDLISKMILTISKLENEPDRILKFQEVFTWDALRSSIVRIITKDVTGFDSPRAMQSLNESYFTLQSLSELLQLFKNDHPAQSASFEILENKINNARAFILSFIKTRKNSENFDRLTFIRDYLDPVYEQMLETRLACGIGIPEGRNPANFSATSIFAKDAFNINFFSPSQDYWITSDRVALGKKLFFDPILSGNNSRSCASCHQPQKAFTDGLKTPRDIDNKIDLKRNTPTLVNSALQTRQFFDSRTDILENQLDEVVHNATEMKGSLKNSRDKLKNSPVYSELFKKAYSTEPDPITTYTIANAISSYIRSLVALNSRFDQYMMGNDSKLTPIEKKGFNIFTGKAKCATCHFLPLFNGLVPPNFSETESEILGVPETKNKKGAKLDPDEGKFKFTEAVIHKYAFKTPTLRNIELTAPYMHNGVFNTLEEVVDFYNKGGGAGLGIKMDNQTLDPSKLNLSKKEKTALIAFMRSLTDTSYISVNLPPNH